MKSTKQTELWSLSSVSQFECTDLDSFLYNLSIALKQLIGRKGEMRLEDQLLSEIQWKSLCRDHDRRRINLSSPLQEVLRTLCKPTIVPLAFSTGVFGCLLRTLTIIYANDDRNRSASEILIFEHMMILAKRLPAQAFSQTLRHILDSLLKPEIGAIEARRLHKYVTVLNDIVMRKHDVWFASIGLTLFLRIAKHLDDVDVSLLSNPNGKLNTNEDKEICLACQKRISPLTLLPTVRHRKVSLLHLLGGEEQDEPIHRLSSGCTTNGDQCRCTHTSRQPLSRARDFTQLSFDCIILRSRAYQSVLNTISCFQKKRFVAQKKFSCVSAETAILLETTLDLTCQLHQSPSVRLSLLLIAQQIGINAFQFILLRLWKRFDDGDLSSLRIWSDVVLDSSQFDNPQRCWNGLKPLLTRILGYCEMPGEDFDARLPVLLRSFAFVLTRRRPWLIADDEAIKFQFQDFVARVSLSFGEARYWISHAMEEKEVAIITDTLRSVGILGLEVGSSDELPSCFGEQMHEWPFSECRSVFGAHRRMGPHVAQADLLSTTQDMHLLSRILQPVLIPCRQEWDIAPIEDHLNEDTLRDIFSFVDHTGLIRCGVVCQSWKTLTGEDTLWEYAYKANYGILGDASEVMKVVSKIGSWKNLFVEKYYSQKALKFKYSATGWKHRTCGYIGCYQVMKSATQQARHYQVHERRLVFKRERHEATKKRHSSQLSGLKRKQCIRTGDGEGYDNSRRRKTIIDHVTP